MTVTRSGVAVGDDAAGKHGLDSKETEKQPDTKKPKVDATKSKKQTTLDESLNSNHQNGSPAKDEKPADKMEMDQESDSYDYDYDDEDTAVEPEKFGDRMPSSVLEKGIIYFFIRGRVEIESPSSVDEIARSYFILRPIPTDAKLGSGPIGDAGNSRLFILPKKVLPKSPKDRFTAFVDKTGATFESLKTGFLAGSERETKTRGTRHTPEATPVGEGVYAITTTGDNSHLVYMLTIPSKLGEIQKKLGLREKASFLISCKNPEFPSPPNARLPAPPKYPQKLMEQFQSYRWIPSTPELLDYVNAQILMIAEKSGIEKATTPLDEDRDAGKVEPKEVMEELEAEDTERVEDLGGDSKAIYADLQARAEDYPSLRTTF